MRTSIKVSGILALSIIFSQVTFISNAKADESTCGSFRSSLEEIDSSTQAKCQDLEAQVPMFSAEGSGSDIGGCWAGSSRSKAASLNSCYAFAIKEGLNASNCIVLANFKTYDLYKCTYRAISYLKRASVSTIELTLTEELRQKLSLEAKKSSLTVPEYMIQKLNN